MTLRPRSLAQLFFLATLISGLTSCSESGDEQGSKSLTQANSRATSLQVEQNSANREACFTFTQPKDAVAPGMAMDETINFYRGLSEMSTGSLSDVFQSVARATVEIAPYYNADEYPPQNLMTALLEETTTAEILCQRLFDGTQTGYIIEPGADLARADLARAKLEGANLRDAKLEGANLSDANLTNASLAGADLRRAKLNNAYLTGANLEGANLTRAKLIGANLEGANLWDADLTGTILPEGWKP